jgi:hypothetical protein
LLAATRAESHEWSPALFTELGPFGILTATAWTRMLPLYPFGLFGVRKTGTPAPAMRPLSWLAGYSVSFALRDLEFLARLAQFSSRRSHSEDWRRSSRRLCRGLDLFQVGKEFFPYPGAAASSLLSLTVFPALKRVPPFDSVSDSVALTDWRRSTQWHLRVWGSPLRQPSQTQSPGACKFHSGCGRPGWSARQRLRVRNVCPLIGTGSVGDS